MNGQFVGVITEMIFDSKCAPALGWDRPLHRDAMNAAADLSALHERAGDMQRIRTCKCSMR